MEKGKQLQTTKCWFHVSLRGCRRSRWWFQILQGITARLELTGCSHQNGSKWFHIIFHVHYTPPNMEPENGPLEKEIPIGNHHFQVPAVILGGVFGEMIQFD